MLGASAKLVMTRGITSRIACEEIHGDAGISPGREPERTAW